VSVLTLKYTQHKKISKTDIPEVNGGFLRAFLAR